MSKRVKIALAVGCGMVALLWAGFNLHRVFGPSVVGARRDAAVVSSALEVPELVLLVALVALLRVNVSLTSLSARYGQAAERCRIAHFWVTVGCLGIAIWYGVLFRFSMPIDADLAPALPPLAVLEACLLPMQVLFAGCVLAAVSTGEMRHMPAARAPENRTARARLVRTLAAVVGSPMAGGCVVTVLVVAILTDVWWTGRLPNGWSLQEWRRLAALVAATLAFISAVGSRHAVVAFSAIVLGVVAGTTWAAWTFPEDIVTFQILVVAQDVIRRGPGTEQFEDHLDRVPQSPDARLAVADVGINRDAVKERRHGPSLESARNHAV